MKRLSSVAILLALALAAPATADPIASLGVPPSHPAFRGEAADPRPLPSGQRSVAPQNPFMAPDPASNIHNDTWMTGAYHHEGPLGRSPIAFSRGGQPSLCGSLAFDSGGRIVSVCPSAGFPPQARVIDPVSLATIATYDLPQAPDPPGTKTYQNFTGGGYFFLDNRDRLWIPTKTDHVVVLAISEDATSLSLVRDYDLTSVLDEDVERITSALPDFSGRIWFVSKANGKVGTVDRKTGRVRAIELGEEIENSFSVAENGVYIVSDKRLYRFEARPSGVPKIVWKAKYENSGIVKPSQVNAGSGTTPDIMSGGYVAITDNADPMNVVVYRRDAKLSRGESRVVCEEPVFSAGASATENSLITTGRSIVVENNYGYQDPLGPQTGSLTEPGFVRVDIKPNGRGCRTVWRNTDARAPSVVPKMSTKTGLIYAYTRDEDPSGSESYYWTAIDWRTGMTVWQQYAGTGLGYNNNYAGLALGPDGTAYLGTFGGMVSLRDGG